jgi:predicted Zn-dependent protease
MKLVQNLTIVLMAVILSGCSSTLASIDSGLYDVSSAISTEDRVTGKRSFNFKKRADQIKESDAVAKKILAKLDDEKIKYNAELDPEGYKRVNTILNRILSVSHFKDEKWTAVLVKDDSFNAFVMGGTYVFVYTGLLDAVATDDEIAAVMGHEIAHVVANHIYESDAYQKMAMILRSTSAKGENFKKSFTSKHEEEADEIGILYSALAGYDPFAASNLWGRMFKESGNSGSFVQDHPINSNRAENTNKTAVKVKPYYAEGKVNPDYDKLLITNSLWNNSKKDRIKSGEGGGFVALLETLGDGYIKREAAKKEARRQENRQRTIRNASQLISIVESKYIDAETWRVRVRYNGSIPLKKLVLAAEMDRKDRVVFAFSGSLNGGKEYYAYFKSSKVDESRLKPNQVDITVDDASF